MTRLFFRMSRCIVSRCMAPRGVYICVSPVECERALGPRDFCNGHSNFCTVFTRAGLTSTCPDQPWRQRTPYHMALTQTIDQLATHVPSTPQAQHSNVIPFPSSRAFLHVTLPQPSHDHAATSLRALLHSPLGVYVVGTQTVREEVRVQLDIACEDLDFTLHTLISTVPVALIGPLQRHAALAKAR
jgi:hypothetical protein